MKAVIYQRYGGPEVLHWEDVAKPAPGDDEVLVRVRAAALNPLDWHMMRGEPVPLRLDMGLRRPKTGRLGVDMAGVVEAVGANVTRFQTGDAVWGACDGAFAEYVCTAAPLAGKPENISFEQAAAVPVAGLTSLQGLRDKGRIQPGQKVLINGAGGGVGTFAVQIAKAFGAVVTAVCSTTKVELVRSLGADRVIDYTQEDFTRSGQCYDLIFDNVGTHSLFALRRALTPRGTYIMVGGPSGRWLKPLPRAAATGMMSLLGQKLVPFMSKRSQDDLETLRDLMAAGKVTPVVGRRYPPEEIREAMRYLEEGHAQGKIVISF
jgi:NADPH:quinone reductase-like Zn-dependent oxidoreductase